MQILQRLKRLWQISKLEESPKEILHTSGPTPDRLAKIIKKKVDILDEINGK